MKQCSKCKQIKPTNCFHKSSNMKDGLRSYCKICSSEYAKDWALKNPEKKKANSKLSSQNQIQKHNSYIKSYYANPEKFRIKNNQWKKNNPSKHSEINNRRRARKIANGEFKISNKFITNLYNSVCVVCKSSVKIQADHIIPISRGGQHSEGNLQPLCALCNMSKSNKTMTEWLYQKRG